MEPKQRHIKETSSLSKSIKGPKTCYGATRNPESTADYKLVTHKLTLFDTLQGLAIKYGVTELIGFPPGTSSVIIHYVPVRKQKHKYPVYEFKVEQIRRVNKLWTNDNILIFKTINIPVKLTFDDGLTKSAMDNCDTPGTTEDTNEHNTSNTENKNQEGDSEESVDSGVHEVNHADINVDIGGHSKVTFKNPDTKRDGVSNNTESLDSFLKNLDGEMKASIRRAKKQRSSTVPALIHSLQNNHEKERQERHKELDSNVRLKTTSASRNRTHKYSQTLDEDSESLDDLFEL